MKKLFSNRVVAIFSLALIALGGYFANVELQSYYGRQALAQAALPNYPLDAAVKKAQAENKRVLVDVAAIWCPTCRRLDREIFANSQVKQALNERFVFARLEYESPEGTAFLAQHAAAGFPNLWILDGQGQVVKKLRVTFNPAEFLSQLNLE